MSFHLIDLNGIELMVGHPPSGGCNGIAVVAFADRAKDAQTYDDFHHVGLGVGWSASDDEIVEAFIGQVERLVATHPRQRS